VTAWESVDELLWRQRDAIVPPSVEGERRGPRRPTRPSRSRGPRRKLEDGAPVVVDDGPGAGELHLPLAGETSRFRARTFCGLKGHIFVFAGALRRRRLCAVCGERAHVTTENRRYRRTKPNYGLRGGPSPFSDRDVEQLYVIYTRGELSVAQIADKVYARFGFADPMRFRSAIEWQWRKRGWKLRTAREAELLVRARRDGKCAAMTTGSDGCRPRPCPQRPLKGGAYCFHHDPKHLLDVQVLAARLRAHKPKRDHVPWPSVRAALEPFLAAQGRGPISRLAEATGVPTGTCSRLLLGRRESITVELAQRLLAGVGLELQELEQLDEAA
jgi:hypothetical protein